MSTAAPTAAPIAPATTPRDAINWFEIPSTDLARATRFYEQLLGTSLRTESFGDPMAMFPSSATGVGGCIVCRAQQKPGPTGATVYLNVDGVLDAALSRVESLGGSVIVPKTPVPGGFGHFACIVDSEGNCVGLHQH